MIGRYTMGARKRLPRLEEGEVPAHWGLPAGHDFEDLEFLAVLDKFGDRDGCRPAHNHDAVGAHAPCAQDFFDAGVLVRKLDAGGGLVEPAADGNFGRNPSTRFARKRLSRELCFKASPGESGALLAEVA